MIFWNIDLNIDYEKGKTFDSVFIQQLKRMYLLCVCVCVVWCVVCVCVCVVWCVCVCVCVLCVFCVCVCVCVCVCWADPEQADINSTLGGICVL